MKILHLIAENIKRLKVVEITPNKNCVVLAGRNGQGKSSVLDSIWLALDHANASKLTPSPVRQGEQSGYVCLDLGDYVVTRRFTAEGTSTLKIETKVGDRVTSPQKLLDGLIGQLAFDPLEFSRLKEKEQRNILLDLLKVDVDSFDLEHKKLYDERSDLSKEKKRLEGILQGITPPTESDPKEEESYTGLVEELNKKKEKLSKAKLLLEKLDTIKKELERLQKERESILLSYHELLLTGSEEERINDLKYVIDNLDKRNKRAREIQQYNIINDSLSKTNKQIDNLSDHLELIKINKAEALESAPVPIKGLSITQDGVIYNNIPFSQLSSAEKTKISMAIAMALNPRLRVLRIVDGSLLDSDSMKVIEEMATEKDFQIWIEKVDESGQYGIVIEDGGIK